MAIFADVQGFLQAHRPCGDFSWITSPPTSWGYRVRLTCPCGAVFDRWVTPEAAEDDLIHTDLTAFSN